MIALRRRRFLWTLAASFLLAIATSSRADTTCDVSSGPHFPHAFQLPMGVVPAAGCHTVQLNGIYQRTSDGSRGDFGGHVSLGLFDWGGIHLRSLGAGTAPTTEVIGMVGLLRDAERRNGMSLLAIVGLPTGPSGGHGHEDDDASPRTAFLGGVTWRLQLADWLKWDANLHYDFTESHVVPESGLVARALEDLFLTLDVRATLGNGTQVLALPGVKYRIARGLHLGLGYERALTSSRPYDSRAYLQVELSFH